MSRIWCRRLGWSRSLKLAGSAGLHALVDRPGPQSSLRPLITVVCLEFEAVTVIVSQTSRRTDPVGNFPRLSIIRRCQRQPGWLDGYQHPLDAQLD